MEAKQDCDAALKLEPTNKKAFYRRAMANKGLKVRTGGCRVVVLDAWAVVDNTEGREAIVCH